MIHRYDTEKKANEWKNKQIRLYQSKKFCISRETINRIKKNNSLWDGKKVPTNHTSDKM